MSRTTSGRLCALCLACCRLIMHYNTCSSALSQKGERGRPCAGACVATRLAHPRAPLFAPSVRPEIFPMLSAAEHDDCCNCRYHTTYHTTTTTTTRRIPLRESRYNSRCDFSIKSHRTRSPIAEASATHSSTFCRQLFRCFFSRGNDQRLLALASHRNRPDSMPSAIMGNPSRAFCCSTLNQSDG